MEEKINNAKKLVTNIVECETFLTLSRDIEDALKHFIETTLFSADDLGFNSILVDIGNKLLETYKGEVERVRREAYADAGNRDLVDMLKER